MSNSFDLQKEGVVETHHNPRDDSDGDDISKESSADIAQNNTSIIQSNISNITDDGKDAESEDDDDDIHSGENESITTSQTPQTNNSTNEEITDSEENNDRPVQNNRINNHNANQANSHNSYVGRVSVLVIIICIVIRLFMDGTVDPPPGICFKDVDPSMKYKLECPKCDAYDHNGKCIIYVPYSSERHTLTAKDDQINDYPCTQFQWDLNNEHILVSGEDTPQLDITFIDAGREDIELTVSMNRTDPKTGKLKYYKEKTCDIILVIYEAPYFGVDLGTTYSCIAYQKPYLNRTTMKRDTNIVVMDQTKMEYCIPSSVYFGKDKKIYIGNNARETALLNNDFGNLIYDIKRIIGRTSQDPSLKAFAATHPFHLNMEDTYPRIIIPNWSQQITAEQLLAIILIELVNMASEEFGVPSLKDVVVSIPAIFHDSQRKAVYTACQIAGLNGKLLVVEPSAASIAHIYYAPIEKLREFNKYFMTLDIGGGTTDVSILRCTGLHCEVLGVAGNSSLGGIDFDNVIVDIMMHKIDNTLAKNEFIDRHPILYDQIVSKAESVKKILSINDEYMVRLMSGKENEYKQFIITKGEFEQNAQTLKLINSIIELAKKAMFDDNPLSGKKGKEHLTNIKAILLIGGTVKIPLIQQMLIKEFVKDNEKTQLIYPSEDPQLMVVKGSAIIGGSMAFTDASNADILYNQIPTNEISIDDVLPMSFGFDVCVIDYNEEDGHRCGVMDILIHKNSKYPTKGSGIYCQKVATSSTATLMLYEGDDIDVVNNFFLAKLEIYNVPQRGEYECKNIVVELSIDENGIAHIIAKTNNRTFSKKLPVQANDGLNLTSVEINVLNQQVMSWFK